MIILINEMILDDRLAFIDANIAELSKLLLYCSQILFRICVQYSTFVSNKRCIQIFAFCKTLVVPLTFLICLCFGYLYHMASLLEVCPTVSLYLRVEVTGLVLSSV